MAQDNGPVEEGERRPLVIAHRGASGIAPENTLAAFRLAASMGADGVEMDVQLSADNRPVVIHDARVDRTTNSAGRVAAFTAGQLGNLDAGRWFERRLAIRPRARLAAERARIAAEGEAGSFAGERVPTLEEALALLAETRLLRVYIELKSKPATRESLLAATVSLIRDFHMERSVTLLSFDHEILKRAKETVPEIRISANYPAAGRQLATARSILRSAESMAVDEVGLHFSLATRRTVAGLHERGLEVSAWTANSKILMRRLISRGVDSIMTNFPDRLMAVLEAPPKGRA
ncbi:MAG: hypothetical protein L0229_07655 [Blastocatellia bacterium]|nr:hypothetical protein [Blastocatellia bacterium]